LKSMQKNQAFKKGDQVAYRNSSVSSKFDFELFGEVLSLTPTKVKVRLTNQKGQVAIKDVKPECLRILSE
jgi:hypothetical protein